MNWGYKIFFSFLLFGFFLSVLVYYAFQSKVQLVSPDYYQQELQYQQQIDKLTNEKSLRNTAKISYDSPTGQLRVIFPPSQTIIEAQLAMYRPSDASMDRSWSFAPDNTGTTSFSLDRFATGLWQVHLEWKDPDKTYFKQQTIFLP
ncbi:MAG: hypothetical protein DHS20C17_14750 [Cyclobacteriaceae bacterium]|nr:MAG: hypothetical protein DHS20C17_14750 [Cyclobacteriaceae bacterium]